MGESRRGISPSISVKADDRLEAGEVLTPMNGVTRELRGVLGRSCFMIGVRAVSLGIAELDVPVTVHDTSVGRE